MLFANTYRNDLGREYQFMELSSNIIGGNISTEQELLNFLPNEISDFIRVVPEKTLTCQVPALVKRKILLVYTDVRIEIDFPQPFVNNLEFQALIDNANIINFKIIGEKIFNWSLIHQLG